MALTIEDLYRTLEDERHLGFGYATRSSIPREPRHQLDELVVARANEEGLTYEELFAWANSKLGRWTVDCWHGTLTVAELEGWVDQYLTREQAIDVMD